MKCGVEKAAERGAENGSALENRGVPGHRVGKDFDGNEHGQQRSSRGSVEGADYAEEEENRVDESHVTGAAARDLEQECIAEGESQIADDNEILAVEAIRGMPGGQ